MPDGKAFDGLVEDVQHHLPALHLHDEGDGYKAVLGGLAALAEQDMRHLPVEPVDSDGGHPAGGAAFAGQDDHVPFYFDHPVTGACWANEAGDKQLGITVVLVTVIGGGHLHGIVLLRPILASQRSGQVGATVPFLERRSLGPRHKA